MGDYATLRFHAVLSPLGVEVIKHLLHQALHVGPRTPVYDPWSKVFADFPELPRPQSFLEDMRHNFIPFGGVSHIPEGWHRENQHGLVSHNVWGVCCSVKTPTTITKFLDEVLPHLIEGPCIAYHQHEMEEGHWELMINPGEAGTMILHRPTGSLW
jgi:hypothetical protein